MATTGGLDFTTHYIVDNRDYPIRWRTVKSSRTGAWFLNVGTHSVYIDDYLQKSEDEQQTFLLQVVARAHNNCMPRFVSVDHVGLTVATAYHPGYALCRDPSGAQAATRDIAAWAGQLTVIINDTDRLYRLGDDEHDLPDATALLRGDWPDLPLPE